eukprot:TRINITY_DN6792_c1_g1_i1.p2 TRINITY_DN6792_c1_g1~~TRINITY_DN6792_c1_g1_i1.p2  ORF type:complete len:102 (+),score=16.63 TRINITY_DN6792_c1_g1_i1:80-385(+)
MVYTGEGRKDHVDIGCKESLLQLMRPHMKHAIDPWMANASEMEKRGILRLMRMAHPDMLNIDKPRKPGHAPTCSLPKSSSQTMLSSAGLSMMKSHSSPALR